ncbi:hypothetical protein ACFVTT_15615 [Streptomyces niveus]|uniref:hypothetical protein n=1 Tax=Streptomyces niveus TaxID=193462 RepID=UPI003429BB12
MSDTPRIAREVRVERRGRIARLFIDGDEFPFHIAADDPIVVGPISGDDFPTVRFTVLAERVDLINDFTPESDDQEQNT